MPTEHARIALVRDEELDRALKRAERFLPAEARRSQAARVRALAIRGAAALAAEAQDDGARFDAALGALGATRAMGTWSDLPPPISLGPPDGRPGSAALDEVRGPR
jgi:hypothetical protein